MLKRIALGTLVVGAVFGFLLGMVMLAAAIEDYRKEQAYQADIAAQIAQYSGPDALLGSAGTTEFGSRSDNWLFKETVTYPGTDNKKVVKTVYNRNSMPFLDESANYRLYEFFRTDGTIERDELHFPYAHLSSSVISCKRVRLYDEKGVVTDDMQIRPDGTVGALSKGNVSTHFRADGKTLRSVQDNVDKTIRYTYYRLDGKTPWWVCMYDDPYQVKVFFDLDGNPYEKTFVRKHLKDGYSAGPGTEPFEFFQDTYKRADGTDDYVQTWYVVWDHKVNSTREVLQRVEILDNKGAVKKIVYLDINNTARDITLMIEFNDDGSILTRKYRKPNQREFEKLAWPLDETRGYLKTFADDGKDHFVEPLDARLLHGFHVDLYGTDDDDSHDK